MGLYKEATAQIKASKVIPQAQGRTPLPANHVHQRISSQTVGERGWPSSDCGYDFCFGSESVFGQSIQDSCRKQNVSKNYDSIG